MSVYFEKARELGNMILASEESKRLADARAIFLADDKAVKQLNEYSAYQKDVQTAMETGVMSKEAFASATKRLTEMGSELKKEKVIGELVQAENEFNFFVNQVMNVLKVTITGESACENSGSCGSGGCSSCSHS